MKRTPLRKVSTRKKVVDKSRLPKRKTTSQLKKQLDQIFSIYNRKKYSDDKGKAPCYTCGVQKDWSELQNGHFISRSHLATRFLESNCRPQCVGCNVFGGGRQVIFGNKLEAEKPGIVKELYETAQQITKDFPYQEKIDYYQQRLKEIYESN